MRNMPKSVSILLAVLALAGAVYGGRAAMRSPYFLVQSVEVTDPLENAPVDAHAIVELAQVPVGQANLFDVDLAAVEKRILSNPWVREVRLAKRFPSTLSIGITLREPCAIIQGPKGALAYVDTDGTVFGRVNLLTPSDLPLLFGFAADDGDKISEALRLVDSWDSSALQGISEISSIGWDASRGYRAMIIYSLNKNALGSGSLRRARANVDFGHEIEAAPETQLRRLAGVFRYLGEHSIEAGQIWADSGKKIVVRTSPGS
jgi:hypothetical protein